MDIDQIKNANVLFVVYPPGSAGDWLSYLISRHYVDSGVDLLPSDPIGKINFIGSDRKKLNEVFPDVYTFKGFDNNFYTRIVDGYYSVNRNIKFEDVSQIIVANHYYENDFITDLLENTSWKFIRVLPSDELERNFLFESVLCKLYKPGDHVPWKTNPARFWWSIDYRTHKMHNERLLELSIRDFLLQDNWENTYSKIRQFLNIDIDLISKNSLQYYYDLQPPHIQECLDKLKNVS